MQDIKVTVASLRSVLIDTGRNLALVEKTCAQARDEGARLIVLPELMLTGHGGHARMAENAEPVPDGPLCQAIMRMSREYDLCICVGMAELSHRIAYNSQIVVDRGEFLGLQRKVNLSLDEYLHFGAGERVPVFDIGDVRFGITICYDNHFPELALIHSLHHVDLILAPHAARFGDCPEHPSPEFVAAKIAARQSSWERVHSANAMVHNVYVLLCNTVGASTEGLEGVMANHAGSVMGIEPGGEVFLRTTASDFCDEIVTVELEAEKRKLNHGPARNRRLATVVRLLEEIAAAPE